MDNEFLKWLAGVFASSGIVSAAGYIFRDSIGRFITKAIEHKYDKKIEQFKSDIRGGESEIAQIRTYISSARSARDSVFQAKKIEAAEELIKIRRFLYQFNMGILYFQTLKIDELFKQLDDPKVKNFVNEMLQPIQLESRLAEYNTLDKDTPKLYLNDKIVKVFDIFESITMLGAAKLRMLEIGVKGSAHIVSSDELVSKIKDHYPDSKKGFEKIGWIYMFQLHDYFYNEIFNEIRGELLGNVNMERDTELAAKLVLDFRDTQQMVKDNIDKYGISKEFINTK